VRLICSVAIFLSAAFSLTIERVEIFFITDVINVLLVSALSRLFYFSNTLSFLNCLAWLIRLLSFQGFSWFAFAHDVHGHLAYIQYITDKNFLSLPKSDWCWECYHPPLYYILSGIVHKVCSTIFTFNLEYYQLLSLICSLVNIFYTNWIFKLLFSSSGEAKETHKPSKFPLIEQGLKNSDNLQQIMASSLVNFWPLSIMNSIRLNNDVLLYTLCIVSLFYLLKWINNPPRFKHLLLSSIAAILAYWTKGNAVLFMIIIIFAFIIHFKSFYSNKTPQQTNAPHKSRVFLKGNSNYRTKAIK